MPLASLQAGLRALLPSSFPDDHLDVRTAKFDVDSRGHVRHLITSEVYLHAPATPRAVLMVNAGSNEVAQTPDDALQALLHHITTGAVPGGSITGSALSDSKFPRFIARSRFGQLWLVRMAGGRRRIFPLTCLRQLYDPAVTGVYLALPAASASVAKAAAHDRGESTAGVPSPLGPNLPAFTVDLKVLVADVDDWGHAVAHAPAPFAPALTNVRRGRIVPNHVPEDDSAVALDTVKEAVLEQYTAANPHAFDFLTTEQREGVTLALALNSPVPALKAISATGAIFPSTQLPGGAIPFNTVKQLLDPAVTTVYLLVPGVLPEAPALPQPPAPVVVPPPTAPPTLPEESPEPEPEPEPSTQPAPTPAPAAVDAPAPPATTGVAAEFPLSKGDIVDAVAMDGSFTRRATVLEVRPFGVMGDTTVSVKFEGAPFPTAGLPRRHILRVITPVWAAQLAEQEPAQ